MIAAAVLGTLVTLWGGCAAPSGAGPGGQAAESALRLELNIPAYRLDACVDGLVVRSYRVAVGTRKYPTPVGDFHVAEVVWNPWWRPPDSPWARDRKVTPPGPDNPLGRVKLTFRPLYHLHGTPEEGSLGQAASHGCVRLANADVIELARMVHRSASPGVAEATLDRLEADPWRTTAIQLATPVPLRIVYRLAEVRDGRLEVHPDVYRRGGDARGQALLALREHGIEVDAVAPGRLDELLREARRSSASLPLEELLRPGGSARDSTPPLEQRRGDADPGTAPVPCN
ncbi:MAG: L,D-transpeptidase [Longimicrobiaceae bacterium]